VGNRTAKDGITYTINTVNEVTTLSDGTTFSYDDNGNRTQKTKGLDTWMYTYDHANRLTKIEKNSTAEGEYVYDGDGKRIQATENSVTTMYIYSGLKTLYEENTTGSACYIFGPTGTIAKRTTINQETHTYYYHTDHLGSTRLVTDESKTIVTAVRYHPFGETSIEGSEHFLFCGKEMDATSLYYFGARYYDSGIGRFLTRDPRKGVIQNPQSLNQYTYCFNNPLKYIDPFGLAATFSDEEAQQAYEEQTDNTDPDDCEMITGEDYVILVQEDGIIIKLDVYSQSGNIIVGYGLVTYPDGSMSHTFCVIVLDNGDYKDHKFYTDDKIGSKMSEEKRQYLADELKKFVGKENEKDLAEAVDILRDKVHELGNENPLKAVAAGALLGAAGGYAFSGAGALAGAVGGALVGVLGSMSDNSKWNSRENFLADLGFYL
jgi:RHS repeat-associated protein